MKPTSKTGLALLSVADLKQTEAVPPWLWHGYLAPGAVTLLTSQWKSGKTTLLSVLLSKMKRGGSLAGLKVARGRAVVVTEEGPEHWRRRAEHLDFGPHVRWLCRPFRGRPTPGQWQDLLTSLALLRDEGLDLVVIDPLAAFLPGDESNAALVLEALSPLQELTTLGLSVLVLHHPRKGRTLAGQAARGSGAMSGFADVLIEMHCYKADDPRDRRRSLRAWSRFEETPRQTVIELSADGTDYRALGDLDEAEFAGRWAVLKAVLGGATGKLTRKEVWSAWPNSEPAPDERTVGRLLERAVDAGKVCREGTGHRSRPFRYWLAGKHLPSEEPYVSVLPPLDLDGGLPARVVLNAAKIVLKKRRGQ